MLKTKKNLYILIVIFLSIIAFVALFSRGQSAPKQVREYRQVTSNMQNYWLKDSDVYFFGGSFFARYDLSQNKVVRLSDYLFIKSGINSVSWRPGSVIFQTNPSVGERDDITTATERLGEKPYLPHWWRYDFQLRQYQLLDFAGISNCDYLVEVSPSMLGCSRPKTQGSNLSKLSVYNLSNKSVRDYSVGDGRISKLAANGNTLYYLKKSLGGKQSIESIDLSSGTKQLLLSTKRDINSFVVNDSGSVLIKEVNKTKGGGNANDSHRDSTTSGATKQQLTIVNNKGRVIISKKLRELPLNIYSNASSFFFSSLDGSSSEISKDGIKQLVGPAKTELPQGSFVFVNNGRSYAIDPDYYLFSSSKIVKPKGYRSEGDFQLFNDNADSGNSWISDPENGSRETFLYLSNVGSSQQELAVGNDLESKGFWPSEFNFKWVVDGIEINVPINPNAVIVR